MKSIYNLFLFCGLALLLPAFGVLTNGELVLIFALLPFVVMWYLGLIGLALVAGAISGWLKPGPNTKLLAKLTFGYLAMVGATILVRGEEILINGLLFSGIFIISTIYSVAIVLIALNGRDKLDRAAISA